MMKDLIPNPGSMLASLESLFLEFNFRRLLYWMFLILVFITGLVVFENFTGYAYFSRMERKVSILKSLNELSKDDIASKPELNSIYQETISELKSYKVRPVSFSGFFSGFGIVIPTIPSGVWKFISGGFLGFMVALSGLMDRRKGNEKWSSTFMGGLVFGILMGIIGIFIPTIYNIWINHIVFPIFQVVGILLFSRKSSKRTVTT